MATLEVYDGQLVILDDWTPNYLTPTESRHYWPTGIKYCPGSMDAVRLQDFLIGKPAAYHAGTSTYTVDGVRIETLHGPEGYAIRNESRPIPHGRNRKGYTWAWANGRWQHRAA